MNISRFEELPIWKKAAELTLKIFEFTNRTEFNGFGCMKEQLNRASLSISTNTAKGFGGPFDNELGTAKETASECQSMLAVCMEAPIFAARHAEICELIENAGAVSQMIEEWEESRWNDILGVQPFCPCSESEDATEASRSAQTAESQLPAQDSIAEMRQQDTAVSGIETEKDNCMP
jgi:four helix bundle protein